MAQPSVLKTLRLTVKGNQPANPKAYIFVQSKLQRGDLPPLEYPDAEKRAEAAQEFFKDVLNFKSENVVVCQDYTKKQVIELMTQLCNEAESFELENNSRKANAIYLNWIGFCLSDQTDENDWRNKKTVSEYFKPDPEVSICFFPLTHSGEPIALSEYCLKICSKSSRTQVVLLQDQ